jgi:pyruvate kinase
VVERPYGERRTKIVCTLGPATDPPGALEAVVAAGMDVARFNFSHGDPADHRRRLARLREIAAHTERPLAALADLQGPKIRTGRFASGPCRLDAGDRFTITARDVPGTREIVSTTWKDLPRHVRPGDILLVSDGLLRLRAERVDGEDVACVVEVGGEISDSKGINLPGGRAAGVALTAKDLGDLALILEAGFDLVALSFVQAPEDLRELRRRMADRASSGAAPKAPAIVAKIEKPAAVERFDEILPEADAIMIARGDLGVELAPERVPAIQKRLIQACVQAGVPVITATEMLETMTTNPRPTRAEASDVANAIEDGTDAVMLSGETARGRYPVEAVQMMARICVEVDPQVTRASRSRFERARGPGIDDAVAHAAAETAADVGARLIVAYTMSGHTARLMSRYRPWTELVAIAPRAEVCRQLALSWGVRSVQGPLVASLDDLPGSVEALCLERSLAAAGDVIVITAGAPLARSGVTNCMRVHRLGPG